MKHEHAAAYSSPTIRQRGGDTVKHGVMLKVAVQAALVVVGLIYHAAAAEHQNGTRVFAYHTKELGAILATKFSFTGSLQAVRRNAQGTGLRFVAIRKPAGDTVVLSLSNRGQRTLPSPGSITYLNDEDEIVAWARNFKEGVHFTGGYVLNLPPNGLFDVDPAGRYFLVGEKPRSTWIGRVDQPGSRICVATNFLGTRVFERGGELLVCGLDYPGSKGARKGQAACLVIEKASGSYKVVKQVRFPGASGVIDVDPLAERFLLESDSDLFPRWFVFDPKTNKKSDSWKAAEAGFFLTTDVLGTP